MRVYTTTACASAPRPKPPQPTANRPVQVAEVINLYYPNRLCVMYVTDLPRMLRLLAEAVTALVPRETRHKLKVGLGVNPKIT